MKSKNLEEGYDTKFGRSESSLMGYIIEAKSNINKPIPLNGQIFDDKWRRCSFKDSPIGIPAARWNDDLKKWGFLGYYEAQALRWWLHADLDASDFLGGMSLETRLVEVKLELTHKASAIGYVDVVNNER